MEQLFDDFYQNLFLNVNKQMKIDIKESHNGYVFIVEIPGINKDDIQIIVEDDIMTIEVEKKQTFIEQDVNYQYLQKERHLGKISRSFKVPSIDQDSVEATYKNGILSIHVKKIQEDKPYTKKISIT